MHQSLLLVDDDETFCRVLAPALRKRSFDVSVAHNAQHAIELAELHVPDCAVIDLCLGDESGLVVLERLVKVNQAVKAVVLTGYGSIATAVEAIKLGAHHYLTKPADADEIVAALQRDGGNARVPTQPKPLSVKRLEWEHLQKVLTEHSGNISAAARALGMHRRTLQRKLAKRPVKH